MKITFAVFVLVVILLEVQILGLLFLNGGNVKVWNAQMKLNDSIIQAIGNK